MDPRKLLVFLFIVAALIGAAVTLITKLTQRTSSYSDYADKKDDVPAEPVH
jgi:hypothetical protein